MAVVPPYVTLGILGNVTFKAQARLGILSCSYLREKKWVIVVTFRSVLTSFIIFKNKR